MGDEESATVRVVEIHHIENRRVSTMEVRRSTFQLPPPPPRPQPKVKSTAGAAEGTASSKPVDVFAFNYVLLALSGIWPPEGLPRAAAHVYTFLSAVAHTLFFTSSISYTLGMLITSKSADAAIGASSDVLVIYLTNYKIYVLLKNKRLIRGLVDALKYEMEVTHPPLRAACRQHDEEVNRLARKVTGWYYALLLSVDATYIFMFLRAEFNNEVSIPQWFPVDLRHGGPLAFFLYCCVPISAALVSGIHTTVFDTTILTFSLLLGAKIDNLARLLRTLHEDEGQGGGGGDRETRLRRLHDCARMHQRIIRFVDDLESALSSLTLAQLLESLAALCMQGYRLTANPPALSEAIPMINFLLWLLLQLWILCWSGENISTKSKELAEIAGGCHWFDESRHFTHGMRMIMVRAQRPLVLTAFKMAKLNYMTYLDIVKNSYSLYTCMLRMKSDKPMRRAAKGS